MKSEQMMLFKDLLHKELAYYQQVSDFLAALPDHFHHHTMAEGSMIDLMVKLEIEGTTRRQYRDHLWQKLACEFRTDTDEPRISGQFFYLLGEGEVAELLQMASTLARKVQLQMIKAVIFLKQYNRLNQQFLLLHDTLSNPAYTGKGLTRQKPGPRHTDQEV